MHTTMHTTSTMSSSYNEQFTDGSNKLDNTTTIGWCDIFDDTFYLALGIWIMMHNVFAVLPDLKEKSGWKMLAFLLSLVVTIVSIGSQIGLFACGKTHSPFRWVLAVATFFT